MVPERPNDEREPRNHHPSWWRLLADEVLLVRQTVWIEDDEDPGRLPSCWFVRLSRDTVVVVVVVVVVVILAHVPRPIVE